MNYSNYVTLSSNVTSSSVFKIIKNEGFGIVFFRGYFYATSAMTAGTVYDIATLTSNVGILPDGAIALSSFAPCASTARYSSNKIQFRPYSALSANSQFMITGVWFRET